MNSRIWLSTLLLLFSGAGFAAATPPLPLYESRPPTLRPADADEGVVVVSISTNSLHLDGVDSLIVDSATARYRLRSLASAYARDYALFVGTLPEGMYNVQVLEERDSFKNLTLSDGDRDMIGSFQVRRGQRCDLGRLVTTQFTLDLITGRSVSVTENQAALLRFAPDSAKLLPAAVECWSKPREPRDIAERYARVHPADGAVAVELPDGRVAVPSGMGSVLIRGTDGKWSVASGEGMEQLLYVDDAADGSLVAVGELNTVVKLGADAKLHPVATGDLPLGNILFVDGNAQDGWHIVHQRASDLRIYHSPTLDSPQWQEIASTATGFSVWSGAKNFWVWPTAGGFAYAVTDNGLIRFYDYGTKTWTERHTPKNNPILGIAQSPGGVIGVLTSPGGGLGGITASQYYSRDAAQTWDSFPTSPYKVKVSAPRVLADGTLLVNGGVFGDTGLQASKDGGQTWTKLSGEISVDDFYWNLPKTGLFNFDKGRDGLEVISHSGDGGATWVPEYLNVDRAMLRAHLKSLDEAEEARKAAKAAKKKKK